MLKTTNDNYNDNVKSFSKKPNVNDNYNDIEYEKSIQVENIANRLVDKFNNQNGYNFYCKVGYALTERTVWNLCESAERGRDPGKLFTWLANREMHRLKYKK